MPASAIFDSHAEAERAVNELRRLGVDDTRLSVIAHHGATTTTTDAESTVTEEHHRNILRGILGGGALGAGLGVAALAIPGVGPLAAAGAIAASAVPEAMGIGAAIGAIGGTLNEVLTKHGISDEDAHYYHGRMQDGAVIVTIEDDLADQALQDVLYKAGDHNAASPRERMR